MAPQAGASENEEKAMAFAQQNYIYHNVDR